MKKYYFENEDAEDCFQKEYFIAEMKEMELDQMQLIEAVRDNGTKFFWCKDAEEVAETDETPCGKECESYKPRNGKNGICQHKAHIHEFGR